MGRPLRIAQGSVRPLVVDRDAHRGPDGGGNRRARQGSDGRDGGDGLELRSGSGAADGRRRPSAVARGQPRSAVIGLGSNPTAGFRTLSSPMRPRLNRPVGRRGAAAEPGDRRRAARHDLECGGHRVDADGDARPKAATVTSFASILATLTATLGVRFVELFEAGGRSRSSWAAWAHSSARWGSPSPLSSLAST
jgi:hypothetical protein